MELNALTAISPIDGRYRSQLQQLDEYFSEYALIKYRIRVEVDYFLFLEEKKFFTISADTRKQLESVAADFSVEDAREIKKIEKTTNHDVKAVEYFLKSKLELSKDAEAREWIAARATKEVQVEHVTGVLRQFLVEPMVPHAQETERYIIVIAGTSIASITNFLTIVTFASTLSVR